MEREHAYNLESKRNFVREVRRITYDDLDHGMLDGALECLVLYNAIGQTDEHPMSFSEFIVTQEDAIAEKYHEDTPRIISLAETLQSILEAKSSPEKASRQGLLTPIYHAKDTIGMWKDFGQLKHTQESASMITSMTTILHEDPDTAKNILESFVARLTVGELATKPLIGLVAVAALAKGLPDWISTATGIWSLMAVTGALAIAKTRQDIDNKLHNKPYLTVESNILHSILGFNLEKSAYFVRMAWLVPTLIGPVIAYIKRGVDISPVLLTQDLLYIGPMIVDLLLRYDLMDTVKSAVTNSFTRLKQPTSKDL